MIMFVSMIDNHIICTPVRLEDTHVNLDWYEYISIGMTFFIDHTIHTHVHTIQTF